MARRGGGRKKNLIVGRKIREIRPMSRQEIDSNHWTLAQGEYPVVIELDSGLQLIPVTDAEGNGPGVLFIHDPVTRQDGVIAVADE